MAGSTAEVQPLGRRAVVCVSDQRAIREDGVHSPHGSVENVAASQPEDALQVWGEESVQALESASICDVSGHTTLFSLFLSTSHRRKAERATETDHNRGGKVDKGFVEVCQEACDEPLTIALRG